MNLIYIYTELVTTTVRLWDRAIIIVENNSLIFLEIGKENMNKSVYKK